jgi:molecular chaperone GrpE
VFAISKFSADLLDIFDNLERAMQHADASLKESPFYKGIEMTHTAGVKTVARFGIEEMENPIGKIFDTKFHEVVFEQVDPKKPPGTIFYVISKGYMIKDRVLRPYRVGVTKKD